MKDSLDEIAERIGTLTEEQDAKDDEKQMTEDLPRRNLNDYDGAHDPEGRADREVENDG